MAEAFLTTIAPHHEASSAGTHLTPSEENQPISEITEKVIKAMNEVNIDVSRKLRNKLTQELVAKADKVIALNTKEELPDYLLASPKLETWDVPDAGGTDAAFHAKVRDDIKKRVQELAQRLD